MEKDLQNKIQQIFREENIPAILAVINSVRPEYGRLCRDTEFNTIVNVAKLDGVQELVEKIIEYVQTNKTGASVGEQGL